MDNRRKNQKEKPIAKDEIIGETLRQEKERERQQNVGEELDCQVEKKKGATDYERDFISSSKEMQKIKKEGERQANDVDDQSHPMAVRFIREEVNHQKKSETKAKAVEDFTR